MDDKTKEAYNAFLEQEAATEAEGKETHIMYFDVNSEYPTAMSRPMPLGDYEWVYNKEGKWRDNLAMILDTPDDNDIGYFAEVDLVYPPDLHQKDIDLPLAPERYMPVPSPYMKQVQETLGMATAGVPKLCCTFEKKVRYTVHYVTLKYYVSRGLKVTKLHRTIRFRQSCFIKPYIEKCMALRRAATNDAEKGMVKLVMNSLFGKMLQNTREYSTLRLSTDSQKGRKWLNSPLTNRVVQFGQDGEESALIGVLQDQDRVKMNQPIAIGVAILDLSKVIIYKSLEMFKRRFKDGARLLYTDTDSLILSLSSKDIWAGLSTMWEKLDLRGFTRDHPIFNGWTDAQFLERAKTRYEQLGLLKSETGSKPILEVCALRPKMYSIRTETEDKWKAKGVPDSAAKRELNHDLYRHCLFASGQSTTVTFNKIQQHKHKLTTDRCQKVALTAYDDKRYYMDALRSVPYGYRPPQ